jgi:UPF0271 protein
MNPQANECKKTAVILDTSAFIAGFDPFSLPEPQLTVPKVEEEISRSSIVNTRFRAAIENGKLKVKVPHPDFLKAAKVSASSLGDSYLLSEADMQLLALALELKAKGFAPQIVTDDYSIQNVASQMEIRFLALATFGIKRLLEWIRYCPACHREYSADCASKECLVCGTQLKRKPRRTVKNLKSK